MITETITEVIQNPKYAVRETFPKKGELSKQLKTMQQLKIFEIVSWLRKVFFRLYINPVQPLIDFIFLGGSS